MTLNDLSVKKKFSWLSFEAVLLFGICVCACLPGLIEVLANGYLDQGLTNAGFRIFTARYFHYFERLLITGHLFFLLIFISYLHYRKLAKSIVFATGGLAFVFLIPYLAFIVFIRATMDTQIAEGLELAKCPAVLRGQGDLFIRSMIAKAVDPVIWHPFGIGSYLGLNLKEVVIVYGVLAAVYVMLFEIATRIRRRLWKQDPSNLSSSPSPLPIVSARFRGLLLILALPLLLGIAARAEKPAGNYPNILLISIDTLRADHLGCYGYRRPTTPEIDAFAKEGALFERAISQSSWTLPSHATMLTGLYTIEHQCNLAQGMVLASRFTTLAETLLQQGYRTAAFVNNEFVSQAYGLNQGFERFEYREDIVADQNVDRVLEYLQNRPAGPFFLFLHLNDPHEPYTPPKTFRELFVKPGEADQFDGTVDPDIVMTPDKKNFDPWAMDVLSRLYDAEIRFVDSQLGRLFATLKSLGLAEKTIVVVTSDHGEAFGENEEITHGGNLYNQLVHVPLIIRYPRAIPPNTRIDRTVEANRALSFTLLDLADITGEEKQESSLVPLILSPESNSVGGFAFSVTFQSIFPKWSVQDDNGKIIATMVEGKLSLENSVLFDLSTDWKNSHPVDSIAGIDKQIYFKYLNQYLKLGEKPFKMKGFEPRLTPQEKEKLRSLGYLH
ncbi:MAG: sulfatase-like hydrolase/transferase [Myxococcales bacterium]|nr:sulfatase-like hydrolase/transferase [Myxococcales bacterium]